MPEPIDKLTQEQKDRVANFLASRALNGKFQCPFCGRTDWFIADDLVTPTKLGSNFALVLGGGPVYPLVMVISTFCGYTTFFNAVVAGVVPASKENDGKSKN